MPLDRDTRLTWYGHACVEIRTPGDKVVLIDPWFGNPLSPRPADSVERCDVMLVTHGHSDHLGDAVSIAERTHPAWPAIHECSLWLGPECPTAREGIIGMNKGGTVEVAGLRVTMTTADHSSGDWDAAANTTLYLGEPAGFVIEVENGFRIYHAGDTNVFGDMRLIAELLAPDLAILPVGGHFTMGPREAALAVELLDVRHVMPIHYGTFPVLDGTPEQLRDALDRRGLTNVEIHAPEPGGTVQ